MSHFGLDDRHQVGGDDLPSRFELLDHDVLDAGSVGLLDERAHLGSEHALRFGLVEQCRKLGHRLHQLDTVLLRCQALVDFQERHDPFHVPQVVPGGLSSMFLSMVFSNRMAPRIRSPVKDGLVMMRVRI